MNYLICVILTFLLAVTVSIAFLNEKIKIHTGIDFKDLGNGDIVFAESSEFMPLGMATSRHVHTGLIVIRDEVPFVYEYMQDKKLTISTLEKWLHIRKGGSAFIQCLNKHPEHLTIPDIKFRDKQKHIGYIRSLFQAEYSEEMEEYYDFFHCNAYVTKILQLNGIVEKCKTSSSYVTLQYMNLGVPTINGYKYERPIFVKL